MEWRDWASLLIVSAFLLYIVLVVAGWLVRVMRYLVHGVGAERDDVASWPFGARGDGH